MIKTNTKTPETDALFNKLRKEVKPIFNIAKKNLGKKKNPIILKKVIGYGGFAVVFEGSANILINGRERKKHPCAVKVVYPWRIYGEDSEVNNANRKRFKNEHSSTRQVYTNLKKLGNGLEKHIVRSYDYGEFDYDRDESLNKKQSLVKRTLNNLLNIENKISWRYIISEYVEGKDLSHYLGKINTKEIIQIGKIICNVLEVTHEQNYLHRDIKPTNILIPNGKIHNLKLGDFGLAKRIDSGVPIYGSIIGSMGFAAPEQIDYKSKFRVDVRTDEYNVGSSLFYMLTMGDYPYSEEDVKLLHGKRHKPIPKSKPLTDFGYKKVLSDIFLKALSPGKRGRYSTIGEFKEALEYVEKKL